MENVCCCRSKTENNAKASTVFHSTVSSLTNNSCDNRKQRIMQKQVLSSTLLSRLSPTNNAFVQQQSLAPIPTSWKQVYVSQINEVQDTLLDLSLHAKPCCYRFIDCEAFIGEDKLVIYESDGFLQIPYVAISYTWRGNDTNVDDPKSPLYWKDGYGTFQVAGSLHGDPISLDVLNHVCTVSLKHSCRFLWLDRLCIMQTNKEDKAWQITKMNKIYKNCELCCILPGGIRRLVRLGEETSWIHRAWTLQEAIVPKHPIVLFAWDHAMDGKNVVTSGSTMSQFIPTDVISGQSACIDLHHLLGSSHGSPLVEIDFVKIPVEIRIFGASRYPYTMLMNALTDPFDEDGVGRKYQYIWRCALLRTSSRSVDMVFSIMGMFGVSLEPLKFHSDDRLGATIALAKEILKKGGKASWIGATYSLDPCPELCTFPQFPETSVAGKAYMRLSDGSRREVNQIMSDSLLEDHYLIQVDTPSTSMDDQGYLIMQAHAVPVTRVTPTMIAETVESETNTFRAEDGTIWGIEQVHPATDPVTYLVYLGKEVQSGSTAFPRRYDSCSLKGWIVQEHAPNKFHRVIHLKFSETYKDLIESLPMMDLPIGGPHSLSSSYSWQHKSSTLYISSQKYTPSRPLSNRVSRVQQRTSAPIPTSWKRIYASQINEVRDNSDLSCNATPCCYRFIDCEAFIGEDKLVIYESDGFLQIPYVAISYTWRGNDTNVDDPKSPLYWKDGYGTFQVAGNLHGDPISLDVLNHVCTVSLKHSCRFLWLDRLCMMLTNREDKAWHIKMMDKIYKNCELCCILPGGIRRLVRLGEETSWIRRAWTLQEAIVSKHPIVLFAWDHAMDGKNVVTSGSTMSQFIPTDVISGQSACIDLHHLLGSSHGSPLVEIDSVKIPVEIRIFGASRYPYTMLMNALTDPFDEDGVGRKYQYIWRCALLRTSSRSVDMVFSIMGMFGVSLEPLKFHSDDRLGATIALAKEILKKGGKASWIGATYSLDPCPELCTFPQFPETSVDGETYMRLSDGSFREVNQIMSDSLLEDHYLIQVDTPSASMDDQGYLIMQAHAVPVTRVTPTMIAETVESKTNTFRAEDGTIWGIEQVHPATDPVTYLVYLGKEVQSGSTAFPRRYDSRSLKGWIVQEHAPNKFHRVIHLKISDMYKDFIDSLPMMDLSIGGPHHPHGQ